MAAADVRIVTQLVGADEVQRKLNQVGVAANKLVAPADRAGKAIGGLFSRPLNIDRIRSSLHNVATSLDSVAAKARQFGSVMSVAVTLPVTAMAHRMVTATAEFNKIKQALTVATGSAAGAKREYEFLAKTAEKLGLRINTAGIAFSQFAVAAKGTKLEGQGVRDVFLAVSKAATALGLSSFDTERALLALQQMLSKGTVSAEELRGQLGEVLPGAFNMAAKAMGVTTAELDKMLQKGEVAAEDLLPKLAKELDKTFGGQAQQSTRTLTAELNRFWNTVDELVAGIGSSGLIELFSDIVRAATDWLKAFQALAPETQRMIGYIALIAAAAGPLAIALSAVSSAVSFLVAGFSALIAGVTAVVAVLGAPILAALAAVAAAVTAVVVAWRYWDEIVSIAQSAWRAVSDFASRAGSAMADLASRFRTAMIRARDAVVNGIRGMIARASDYMRYGWASIWNAITNSANYIRARIAALWSAVAGGIVELLGPRAYALVSAAFARLWAFGSQVFAAVKAAVLSLFGPLYDALLKLFAPLRDFIQTRWAAAWTFTSDLLKRIQDNVLSLWDTIKKALTDVFNKAANYIQEAWRSVLSFLGLGADEAEKAVDKLSSSFRTLGESASSASPRLTALGGSAAATGKKVEETFAKVKNLQRGVTALPPALRATENAADDAGDAIGDLGSEIAASAKHTQTMWRELDNVVPMLKREGLEALEAERATGQLGDTIAETADVLDDLGGAAGNANTSLRDLIESTFGADSAMTEFLEGSLSAFRQTFTSIFVDLVERGKVNFKDLTATLLSRLTEVAANSLWTELENSLAGWISGFSQTGSAAQAAAQVVQNSWSGLSGFFSSLWDSIASGVSGLWDWISNGFSSLFSGISKSTQSIGQSVSSIFGKGLSGSIIGAGVGGIANMIFGNDSNTSKIGGTIGGAVGGGLGSFFGPVGSVIGGFLGGSLGSLLGKPSDRGQLALYDFATDTGTTDGAKGDKFSQANLDTAVRLSRIIAQYGVEAEQKAGGKLTTSFYVKKGDRDGLRGKWGGEAERKFASEQELLDYMKSWINKSLKQLTGVDIGAGQVSDSYRKAVAAQKAVAKFRAAVDFINKALAADIGAAQNPAATWKKREAGITDNLRQAIDILKRDGGYQFGAGATGHAAAVGLRYQDAKIAIGGMRGAIEQFTAATTPEERAEAVASYKEAAQALQTSTQLLQKALTATTRVQFAQGGWVPGHGHGDIVPALLTPGEFVVSRSAARRWAPILKAINDNSAWSRIARHDLAPQRADEPNSQIDARLERIENALLRLVETRASGAQVMFSGPVIADDLSLGRLTRRIADDVSRETRRRRGAA